MQPPFQSEPTSAEPSSKSRPALQFVFNAYLICFTLQAFLTLASPLIGDGARLLVSLPALFLPLVVLILIGSFKNLPWHPLLPALLFSLWEGCLYLPLPALFMGTNTPLLITGGIQFLVGCATMLYLKRTSTGASFLFQENRWNGCQFSMGRTVIGFGVKMFILLPCLVLYLAWSAQWMLTSLSRGFIHIDTNGLYTESRDYRKDGKTIHLLPTVHVAAPAFYDTLMESLPVSQLVVLPEGVTDKNHLMKAQLDYSAAADSVGLSTQPDLVGKRKEPATQPCDADISDFSPTTVAILNGIARALQTAAGGDALGALQSLSSMEDKDAATVIKDIIETRNMKVVEGVQKALEQYPHVAVPWGAAHMPGIEREILRMDFQRTDVRRVQVFSWKELKLSKLSPPR